MKPIIAVPAVLALVHRAWSRKSLTPLGILAAALTAIAHVVHPWSAPFALLVVFYLGGTKVTKVCIMYLSSASCGIRHSQSVGLILISRCGQVKHEVKARLTLSATGAEGGEGQRTHIQVLANSVVATVLVLLHAWVLACSDEEEGCFSVGGRAGDVLVVGIVAYVLSCGLIDCQLVMVLMTGCRNYAAVAADTFSSELGILSRSKPRLITSPTLRVVPPGTNGGVTATGLLAGVLGAFTIAVTSAILIPFCSGEASGLVSRVQWVLAVTVWGALGSVLDSILGGLFQASVVDKRSGKIVEGTGGGKVCSVRCYCASTDV